MTLKSLEDFDKEIAAKRARLEKDHALAHALPTVGVTVAWTGENGWDEQGKPRPPISKTIALAPHIIHSPFRGAEHVAFRAPDSMVGEGGEHVSSTYRTEFVHKYLRALLDTCAPHMIDTVAIKGHYASNVPETFDYAAHRDYSDAEERARGLYEVEVSTGAGFTSAKLQFYIRTEKTGTVQVSFDLSRDFQVWRIMPRAVRRSADVERSLVRRWDLPSTGACHHWRRGGADTAWVDGASVPQSYTVEWLYDTREALEHDLGL
jgi:hypothetical protein